MRNIAGPTMVWSSAESSSPSMTPPIIVKSCPRVRCTPVAVTCIFAGPVCASALAIDYILSVSSYVSDCRRYGRGAVALPLTLGGVKQAFEVTEGDDQVHKLCVIERIEQLGQPPGEVGE